MVKPTAATKKNAKALLNGMRELYAKDSEE